MIRRVRRDGREARGMRKGRRERIEKGSREGIEKETKRQFEEEGLRDLPLLEFLDPTLRCSIVPSSPQGIMTSWSSSIKICFLQAYRKHYLKNI